MVEKWITYRDVQLWKVANRKVYLYIVDGTRVDADGAHAYHPDDTGIDALANGGFPHGGWTSVLVADPEDPSRPYRQVEGEFAGYFVSMTTLQDQTRAATDIHRYVDSRLVPYLVFPGAFFALKGTGNFGDIGAALNLANGKESPVIVADKGPRTLRCARCRSVWQRTSAGCTSTRARAAACPEAASSTSSRHVQVPAAVAREQRGSAQTGAGVDGEHRRVGSATRPRRCRGRTPP